MVPASGGNADESDACRCDAYNAQVKVEQGAIAFEKANILFNLGAILSQMAAARPTSTADDLKAVFAEFQSAAAVLSYAKETFLHAPLPDLGKPSLEFLVQLMLAQAQEAAARKASLQHHTLVSSDRGQEDRTSSKLLARLWHSTAVHYATSLKHWYAPSAASLRKTVQETVPQLIDQKYKLATCLSLLFSGKHAWDEERAGEALARLDAALAICTSVTETDEQALQIQFTTLKDDFLVKMREKVEKENSLIFHEPIPAVVQELEPASLVSLQGLPAVLRSISDQEQRDIFSRAVPKHIRSEVARYREEVDKLVGYEGHLIEGLEREIEGLQNEAQNALSDPSAYSLLELRAKVKEPAMRLTESAKDVNATAGRLQEVIRAELDLNGERLKGLSRGLFDSSSITAEQRRPLLERIDVIAAVYESFATDLKELEQVPLADDAIKMEQRVREYSEGKFGLELGASSKTEKLSLPSVPSSSELLSSAREAYRELREEGSHSDITQELVKAKPGHSEQAIQDKLKTFDPLAAQIESSVTEARKRLQSCKINVEKAIAEHRSDPAFKEIDEQVRKRRMLLNFYDSELGKQRYQRSQWPPTLCII